jgi:uncharacterized protein YndB with AHSA1/START domain
MIHYELSENINAEPARVFHFLEDADLYTKWMAVEEVTALTPTTEGKGSRWRMVTKEGPFVVEVVEFEPDRSIVFDSLEGPFVWRAEFKLDPQSDGSTKVTSSGDITFHGARRLLQPIAGAEIRKGEAAELTKLKALAEAS